MKIKGRETQPLRKNCSIGRSLFSFLILIGIGGCQGDRIASGWFAPDPQLEQPASEPSPTPTPSPIQAPTGNNPEGTLPPAPNGDTEEEDETRLPATFPTDVPSYPQSQLLAASYRAGQGTGSTDWKSQASPKKIASFYQQFLTDKGWKLEQKFSEDKPETVLLTEPHELRITFPNEGMFRIAYRDTSVEPQAADTSKPTVGVASGQVVGDLQALNAIPADFDPEAVINRRTFARWLLTTHNQLYRDRATKQIRPATSSSQPAFQDIPASDPDFATIQGLAEAGIIPSRLTGETDALLFQPDAPLTRETLIAWKVPLDRRGCVALRFGAKYPAGVGISGCGRHHSGCVTCSICGL
jgi:hypothetical protein